MICETKNPEDFLVSVIVATYRRDKELCTAIMSLIQQTHKNIEIIVVDDNADIIWNQKISGILDGIKIESDTELIYIVNDKNRGSAETRNIGIAMARGEYVTFLDDDDIYLPKKIEMQLGDFLAYEADYGITDLIIYDEKDNIVDKRIRGYIESTDAEELIRYHMMYHMTGTDTLMFRTEYLRKIGGFPEIDVGDEYYLMKKAILGGGRFNYSHHCYVKAYIHSGEDSGLSSGQKKIDGENYLFRDKKKDFNRLKPEDIRYIKSRHFAVIAFAEYRRHSYGSFFYNAIKALLSSPNGCFKILFQHKKGI